MAEEERVEQTAKMVMDEDEEESKARPRAMREELKKPEFQPIPLMEHSVDNPRGIPKAIFIENVEEFAKTYPAEQIVNQMSELYNKYKFMESKIQNSKAVLKNKLPDIKKSLEVVSALETKAESATPEVNSLFLLSDNIWAKAKVPNNTGNVGLWLGANVMIEYNFSEARELLNTNLGNAEESIKFTERDLNYIKDQITTTEVNLARVHNEGVRLKQRKQAVAAGKK